MVFHEITKDAIIAALENTRDINVDLVDAQETRRIVDRLVRLPGVPCALAKVVSGLSAGRVQSVAVRLVVERERERIAFTSARDFDATFERRGHDRRFPGNARRDGRPQDRHRIGFRRQRDR